MSNRFHVNPTTGETDKCFANFKPCPHSGVSGKENHYDTSEQAQAAAESLMASRYEALSSIKKHPNFGKIDDETEFSSPFSIDENGSVVNTADNVYAPDVFLRQDGGLEIDDDVDNDDWEAVSGFSGQQDYRGPCMHASEVMSGSGMEQHIRTNPGTYVLEIPMCDADDDDFEENGETIMSDSWVLLKQKEKEKPPVNEPFKSLTVGSWAGYFGKVETIRDWADGSRTVKFSNGKIMTRKNNPSMLSILKPR